MQTAFRRDTNNKIETLSLPTASTKLFPELLWGDIGVLYTPAWWAVQHWHFASRWSPDWQRLGSTLREETIACLLGTAGVPAEVAHGAFRALKKAGLTRPDSISEQAAFDVLSTPVETVNGPRRYRFARRKAQFLSKLPKRKSFREADKMDDLGLRDWLLSVPGVGLKVASWIVRNHRATARVAVLDVHIRRAGAITGFLPARTAFSSSYHELESAFLKFADAIGAAPASLDCLMWTMMRATNQLALKELRLQNAAA